MTRRRSVVTIVSSAALFLASGFLYWRASTSGIEINLGAGAWEVLTALGTVGATALALALALTSLRRQRDRVARLVSAWVTEEYVPRTSEQSYRRIVVVHVANEGDEPVFSAHLSVVVGASGIPIGPLSAPPEIAVLPPRRELTYDVSIPLLAHGDTYNPRVELEFSDPSGRRWRRDGAGTLVEVTDSGPQWLDADTDLAQLGDLDTVNNPMIVALAFLAGLRDGPDPDVEFFEATLAPEAPGWDTADWKRLRQDLELFQPTSMVDYPAPHVARVKLSGDPNLEGKTVAGHGKIELKVAKLITLTFAPERGWRVFGVGGAVPPDKILFPDGTFTEQ